MAEIKQQSKRGGARPGAGRKKGAKDAIKRDVTKERAAAVHQAVLARVEQSDGKMDPVEAIMETVEWAVSQWRTKVQANEYDAAREWAALISEWGGKAAPYIRPRLAAVEARINVNVTIYERIERANQRLIAA